MKSTSCFIHFVPSWTFPLVPRIWSNMHRSLALNGSLVWLESWDVEQQGNLGRAATTLETHEMQPSGACLFFPTENQQTPSQILLYQRRLTNLESSFFLIRWSSYAQEDCFFVNMNSKIQGWKRVVKDDPQPQKFIKHATFKTNPWIFLEGSLACGFAFIGWLLQCGKGSCTTTPQGFPESQRDAWPKGDVVFVMSYNFVLLGVERLNFL